MHLGQPREDEGRREGLRPEGEVEDPGRLIGQDEADGHQCIRAPVRNAREREPEELLDLVRLPVPTLALALPARRDQAGAGVPGGSGNTGSFFGLIDSKQLKTFCPLFSVATYLFPDTLM